MVKMTRVTRTQCVQNFSLSRYTRLQETHKLLVLGKTAAGAETTSGMGRLVVLFCNKKETYNMQRAAGQKGDTVTSPNAIWQLLTKSKRGAGGGGWGVGGQRTRRGAELCNDLASISQLVTDLRQLGLILKPLCKSGILPLKPPCEQEQDPWQKPS